MIKTRIFLHRLWWWERSWLYFSAILYWICDQSDENSYWHSIPFSISSCCYENATSTIANVVSATLKKRPRALVDPAKICASSIKTPTLVFQKPRINFNWSASRFGDQSDIRTYGSSATDTKVCPELDIEKAPHVHATAKEPQSTM